MKWRQAAPKHFFSPLLIIFPITVHDADFSFQLGSTRDHISSTSGLHEQHDWAQGGVLKHPHCHEFIGHHTNWSRGLVWSWSLCEVVFGEKMGEIIVFGVNLEDISWSMHVVWVAFDLQNNHSEKIFAIHLNDNIFFKRGSFKDYCSNFYFLMFSIHVLLLLYLPWTFNTDVFLYTKW